MIRATTPTHIFTFNNLDPSTFKALNIYYAQQDVELLVKEKNDCTFSFLAKKPSIKSVKKNPIAAKPVANAPILVNIGIIASVPNERTPVIRLTKI